MSPDADGATPRKDRADTALHAAAPLPDQDARAYSIDPRHNVVLEASAGTGKTTILVRRYLALLDTGVDPANILAITFTRKAAAEMRERIIAELRQRADQSPEGRRRWLQLRDRIPDIAVSTIDAFCLALLGEFPLEADLDPGFGIADETDVARIREQALDLAVRAARRQAPEDAAVLLLFARLPPRRFLRSLGRLVDRRVTAAQVFDDYLRDAPSAASVEGAVETAAARVGAALKHAPGGLLTLVNDRPSHSPRHDLVQLDIETIVRGEAEPGALRAALMGLRPYFVAQNGEPRKRPHGVRKQDFPNPAAWTRHAAAVASAAPAVAEALGALDRDTKTVFVRALRQVHRTAVEVYRRQLRAQDALDFTEALVRTVRLLAAMDEFAQSRFRLQSRYHHVLVDELQDTSRLQWRLIGLLVEAWGEGSGLAHEGPVPPTIFVVGDRKQSIYRFRDADVSVLQDAAGLVGGLRPDDQPRRSISTSFRARPELQAFVNDVCAAMAEGTDRRDRFRFEATDRFPVEAVRSQFADVRLDPPLGLLVSRSETEAARLVAQHVVHILRAGVVRDRDTGVRRPAKPADIAVLFRVRDSHRHYETALEQAGVRTYVYKGLGFFDAEEIQDVRALIEFLARPASPRRLAALLRSRLVGLSDEALRQVGPDLVQVVTGATALAPPAPLPARDQRLLELLRPLMSSWLERVDRVPVPDLVDGILRDIAYDEETKGPTFQQARENVKKIRGLIRRLHSRGYLTMARLAEHLARLSVGDESNAVIDAVDAVNLMTIHAAKGLEFPIVILVDLARGAGQVDSVRLVPDAVGLDTIAVSGFDGAGDAQQRSAEREEIKRLLYVALTRARDRLVLSVTLGGPRFLPARGSLAEIIPPEFTTFLEREALSPSIQAVWHAPTGLAHYFSREDQPIDEVNPAAAPQRSGPPA
ncbi:MAG: UvrD-helicase domain-containing protein [Vicinamibacterales bacterium]